MQELVLKIAADVITRACQERPADAVLRAELKSQPALDPLLRRDISRAVFAYFRWRGWLDERQSVHDQIVHASQVNMKFVREPESFADADLVARAVPEWLAGQVEVSPALARALQTEPRLWLRAHAGQGRELAAKLGEGALPGEGFLADAIEYRGPQDLYRTPEFHAGEFEMQNLSSQVVSLLCAPQPGETWWDACAGEGGKTLHLSDLMRNKGLIWATDRAPWRLKLLKRRTARAQVFNYRAALWDGSARLPTQTKFDGVLLDAPCSSVGTWQRNPHARWTTTPEDVHEMAARQRELLGRVADSLKPGGKLFYSVCTLTRAETVETAESFGKAFSEFKPLALTDPFKPTGTPAPQLWIWPQANGGNGMFIAGWQR